MQLKIGGFGRTWARYNMVVQNLGLFSYNAGPQNCWFSTGLMTTSWLKRWHIRNEASYW